MGYWRCKTCNGCGTLPAPNRRWWQWWKRFVCPDCMGDGHARPTKYKSALPLPPPPPRIILISQIQEFEATPVMLEGKIVGYWRRWLESERSESCH